MNALSTRWRVNGVLMGRSLSTAPQRVRSTPIHIHKAIPIGFPLHDQSASVRERIPNESIKKHSKAFESNKYSEEASSDESIVTTIDGSTICIRGRDGAAPTLQLPIPWLWLNDPRNVQKASGQKLATPLSYFSSGARVVRAFFVPEAECKDSRVATVPRGSLHPVGGMWRSSKTLHRDRKSQRLLLKVVWKTRDQSSSFDSFYSLDWLHEQRGHVQQLLSDPPCIRSKTRLSTMDYSQLMVTGDTTTAARFQLMHSIFSHGAAIVRGVPAPRDDATSPVAKIGKLLSGGALSHGYLYDDVFHVETLPDAINIAYTSVALPPHQDMAYYESPPGLQLLHCAENTNVTGGASTLVDALAAADALRCIAPDIFRTLTETNATFIKQREGADMSYHRPHIRLDASGQNVVSVHWSPPFEGPLQQVMDPEQAMQYYVAHAAFQRMLDNSLPMDQYLLSDVLSNDVEDSLRNYAKEHTWEQQLQEGDMLIFNNQRMLHGRRPFMLRCPETSRRHLVGCYTNIDDSLSEYRVLLREQADQQQHTYPPRVGNGSI